MRLKYHYEFMGWDGLLLLLLNYSNKLQDNAESSDIFINKAVLTVASYIRTVYYKYNRIPVFYHLPLAFRETN